MVSSKKFVATQKTSMSGGPIVGDIFVRLALSLSRSYLMLELPVQQRPKSEYCQRCVVYRPGRKDAYKAQVARAEEHLDQNPTHFAKGECSSCKKSECRVETFSYQFATTGNMALFM
jgi:hypothetical protein